MVDVASLRERMARLEGLFEEFTGSLMLLYSSTGVFKAS